MRIAELARRADVKVSTIRFYERAGILPEPPRTPGGYRDYDADAVVLVRFLRRGQQLGFGLAELAAFSTLAGGLRGGTVDRTTVAAVAAGKLREIDARIDDLRRTRDALVTLLDTECIDPSMPCPVVAALAR